MRPWVKAGVIGGAVGVILTVSLVGTYILPPVAMTLLALCLCVPWFLVFPATGVLAAHWAEPPYTAQQGAGFGALSGVVAAGIDGVVSILLYTFITLRGIPTDYLESQLPPGTLEQLEQSRLGYWFTPSGMIVQTVVTSVVMLIVGAALAALGGWIYAATKKE